MKNYKNIVNFLKINKINYVLNEPIKNHTSIKIGGNATFFAYVKTEKQFVKLLNYLISIQQKFYILGNGTNTLASDNGYNGVVICTKKLKKYKVQNYFNQILKKKKNKTVICDKLSCNNYFNSQNTKLAKSIYVQTGMGLFEFCKLLKELELGGLEFAYGIPGSIGGAICMNAGAFNKNIGDFVEYVKVYNNGKIKKIKRINMNFAYRQSIIQNSNLIVLGVKFNLQYSTSNKIEKLQQDYFNKRLSTQPYSNLSFGSVFKRNLNFEPVSKLIDDLGLKGYRIGGAEISKKHAGFIVNIASATCQDCLLLIKYIQQKVYDAYGFIPEPEVKLLED